MTAETLDPRRHAFRADLADERLRDRVSAGRFTAGEARQIACELVPLRGRPDARASWTTEALFGEIATVFDEQDGWAWVQLARDGYVGYLPATALSREVHTPTHWVSALGSFVYPEPDVKAPPRMHLAMNAELAVAEVGPTFVRLACGGFVPAQHVAKPHLPARDYVDVAEGFVGVPYQWGGKTRLGLDCSGLVQVALQACGVAAPRDSDMQERELGHTIAISPDLEGVHRGDLVFWKGHVGLLADAFTLLHANAHHMCVVAEPLHAAVERIAQAGSAIRSIRRLHEAGA